MKIYRVKNLVNGQFMALSLFHTDDECIRAVKNDFSSPNVLNAGYSAKDFEIYRVGEETCDGGITSEHEVLRIWSFADEEVKQGD